MNNYSKNQQYSILIPDANDWSAIKIMRCFSNFPKIKIYLLSNIRNSIAKRSKYCTKFFYYEDNEENSWIQSIYKICDNYNIDILIPSNEAGFSLLVDNQNLFQKSKLKIPMLPNKKIFQLTKDKWLFYNFLVKNNLPVEPAFLLGERNNLKISVNDLKRFKFPALIKPSSEKGGFGIICLNSVDEFNSYKKYIEMNGFSGMYYLQGFIPGYDVSMAVYCNNGNMYEYAIHKSLDSTNNFGPQRTMEFINDQNLVEIADKCLRKLKWNGIACIDFRIDERDNKPKIIEFNPRFGQALLGWYLAGINFPLILLLDAFNKRYPPMFYKNIKYAHTLPQIKMILKCLISKKPSLKFLEYKGGFKFAFYDPLPELFYFFQELFNKLRQFIHSIYNII